MSYYSTQNGFAQKMPFGKYKGQEIADIDDQDYLVWVLSNIDVREPLKSEIVDHLSNLGVIVTEDMFFKGQNQNQNQSKPKFDNSKFNTPIYLHPDVDMKKMIKKLVDTGYKQMALKMHPDHGGSKEDLIALGDCKEWLYKGLNL